LVGPDIGRVVMRSALLLLDEQLDRDLSDLARVRGQSRSNIARRAIRGYIARACLSIHPTTTEAERLLARYLPTGEDEP
jgi:hypothetical protein